MMNGKLIVIEVREATGLEETDLSALALTGARADKLAEIETEGVPVITKFENVPGDGTYRLAWSLRWGQKGDGEENV